MSPDAVPALRLVCGNRNYSSWSLRAWLCLRRAGYDPDTVVLPMDTPEFSARIADLSPSRRVPVLWLGDECVWDSLAIAETVNERLAAGRLWPEEARRRAFGRCMAAEMHSSFAALRAELPMNCRARGRTVAISEAAARDIERVCSLWEAARAMAAPGPWLLGAWSIADAMFAPVVLRFRGYQVTLPPVATSYVETWLADADLQAWIDAAQQEPWRIDHEEVGTPAGA